MLKQRPPKNEGRLPGGRVLRAWEVRSRVGRPRACGDRPSGDFSELYPSLISQNVFSNLISNSLSEIEEEPLFIFHEVIN